MAHELLWLFCETALFPRGKRNEGKMKAEKREGKSRKRKINRSSCEWHVRGIWIKWKPLVLLCMLQFKIEWFKWRIGFSLSLFQFDSVFVGCSRFISWCSGVLFRREKKLKAVRMCNWQIGRLFSYKVARESLIAFTVSQKIYITLHQNLEQNYLRQIKFHEVQFVMFADW